MKSTSRQCAEIGSIEVRRVGKGGALSRNLVKDKPVAAIKPRHDEAQGEPLDIRPIPFYSHPQLGASVSLIGFRGDTPMYAMQRTTST